MKENHGNNYDSLTKQENPFYLDNLREGFCEVDDNERNSTRKSGHRKISGGILRFTWNKGTNKCNTVDIADQW